MQPWLWTVAVLAWTLAATSPAEVRRALDEVRDDSRYQWELPGGSAAEQAPSQPVPVEVRDLGPARILVTIANVLFWGGVILAVLLLLVWVARELAGPGRAARVEAEEVAGSDALGGRAGPRSLPDPERLAGAGRFGEAVHALLLHALSRLREGGGDWLTPAMTSRQVLRRAPLDESARTSLGLLVGSVEASRFGGRPAGRDDWERCAASYQRVWGGRGEGA